MQFNLLQNSCTSKSTLSSHRGMGISTHMHTHVHACARMHTYVYMCTCVCRHAHAQVHVCAGVRVCTYMCRCTRVCTCVHTDAHLYACTHTHTHASSSPTVNLPPQREAMPTTARRCCSADSLVTSCSSDREGLVEEAGGPGGDGKLSSRKDGHRRSPPSRPHSPRQGLWEVGPRPGETEGDSQVLLFAPMRATRLRASTAQEQKGPRAWRPRAWKPDIRGSGANLTGTPRPPVLQPRTRRPLQCHRGPAGTPAQQRCARPPAEGKGSPTAPDPRPASQGPGDAHSLD